MPNHNLPSAADPAEDLDESPSIVGAVDVFVGRTTPLEVRGDAGQRHASIRVGHPRSGSYLALMSSDDTRLAQLIAFEQFGLHLLFAVRLALREEADHAEERAKAAKRVEVTDDTTTSSIRSAS